METVPRKLLKRWFNQSLFQSKLMYLRLQLLRLQLNTINHGWTKTTARMFCLPPYICSITFNRKVAAFIQEPALRRRTPGQMTMIFILAESLTCQFTQERRHRKTGGPSLSRKFSHAFLSLSLMLFWFPLDLTLMSVTKSTLPETLVSLS